MCITENTTKYVGADVPSAQAEQSSADPWIVPGEHRSPTQTGTSGST
jgi:hypothetical protein